MKYIGEYLVTGDFTLYLNVNEYQFPRGTISVS